MSSHQNYFDDSENVVDFEESSDAPSVRRIMASKNSEHLNERFSGNYNPKRRKLLTVTDKENEITSDIRKTVNNVLNDRDKVLPNIQNYKESSDIRY